VRHREDTTGLTGCTSMDLSLFHSAITLRILSASSNHNSRPVKSPHLHQSSTYLTAIQSNASKIFMLYFVGVSWYRTTCLVSKPPSQSLPDRGCTEPQQRRKSKPNLLNSTNRAPSSFGPVKADRGVWGEKPACSIRQSAYFLHNGYSGQHPLLVCFYST